MARPIPLAAPVTRATLSCNNWLIARPLESISKSADTPVGRTLSTLGVSFALEDEGQSDFRGTQPPTTRLTAEMIFASLGSTYSSNTGAKGFGTSWAVTRRIGSSR